MINRDLSARRFFIRSKTEPQEYWYCRPEQDRRIWTSRIHRTLFRISVVNETADNTGLIMIGSDNIVIALTSGTTTLFVNVNNSKILEVTEQPLASIKFADLKDGFLAQPYSGNMHTATLRVVIQMTPGEKWELV